LLAEQFADISLAIQQTNSSANNGGPCTPCIGGCLQQPPDASQYCWFETWHNQLWLNGSKQTDMFSEQSIFSQLMGMNCDALPVTVIVLIVPARFTLFALLLLAITNTWVSAAGMHAAGMQKLTRSGQQAAILLC
jgi:hypothetical protein